MLSDDNIIEAQLTGEDGSYERQLPQISEDLLAAVREKFTGDHKIKISDPDEDAEDEWNRVISVSQGAKIGASLDLRWDARKPDRVKAEIDEKTRFGTIVYAVFVVPLFFLGAYMGAEDIDPLAFLPGYKIAAALGGIILAIPGAIVGAIVKPLLMRKEAPANKQMRADLVQLARDYFGEREIK